MMELSFKECEICAAKPGFAILCSGCLHNRSIIYEYRRILRNQKEEIERLYDHNYRLKVANEIYRDCLIKLIESLEGGAFAHTVDLVDYAKEQLNED